MLGYSFVFVILLKIIESKTDTNHPIEFTSRVLIRRNDSNFLEYQGSRYYFNTDFKVNFYGALQFCKVRNMELISIESPAENNRIKKFLEDRGIASTPHNQFWTSATNLVERGKWTWLSTGKEIKYFNWGYGEPLGIIPFVSSLENCLVLKFDRQLGVTWHDYNCLLLGYAICEESLACKCSMSNAKDFILD